MQDLNDMMVFLAVVESGSFTLAAERLEMPKANVSRKVSRLERQLGVTLLERSTRAQHLTEAGKRYLSHCKRIQEEMELASAAVSEVLTQYTGNIKVGASVTLGQRILKPAISPFLLKYPDLSLDLNFVNERVDLIEGGFDMVIRVGMLDDSRLVGKKLGVATRSLYASRGYLGRRACPSTLEAIESDDFLIMPRIAPGNRLTLIRDGQPHTLRVNPRLRADDFATLKQAAIEGLGIAPLPDYMCTTERENGTLVKLCAEWGMEPVDIYALYPQHRAKIPKVRALLEHIEDTFGNALKC
ncbi:LysR family transcriptional regulator [Enterovibrio coralii]|uniref:LysR family transcriptional regulator n=1 Tax=Enterovibrio coralii TaxID=294935 RepID=A0A135IBL5_9GAMM|nr:LysR family transcriptional regulator [Enterovibrio coralii]KXF82829.1 LysR family transcriptional regulator [Enterovibrio coralii]